MLRYSLSWFTDVSTYYLRLERLFFTVIGILILAAITLYQPFPFAMKAIFFIIFSLLLFFLHPISCYVYKNNPIKITKEEEDIIESIKESSFSDQQKLKLIDEYIPNISKWKKTSLIIISWWVLVELFMVCGFAEFLSFSQSVKDFIEIIPTHIFLENAKRSEYDITLLKIFMMTTIISLPFKIPLMIYLIFHFIKSPKIFPISPTYILTNNEFSVLDKFYKILWSTIGLIIFSFCFIILYACIFLSGYSLEHIYDKNSNLTINLWYKTNSIIIIFGGLTTTCAVKIVSDWIYLIISLFHKKEDFINE